tara:strand:- start:2056 stop:2937 length:882 start_codon:yes stop_codon:yes gene_type:complete
MKFIYLIIFSSFIYSECADNDQLNCNANCEWISDLENLSCDDFGGSTSCENYAEYGCSWEFSWGGWQNYGSSCVGGSFQIDNGYCQEIEMPECNEEYEFQCNDGSCIPLMRVCNSIDDCEDGSDEINCEGCSEMLQSECGINNNCEWVEDSSNDCEDFDSQFQCNNGNGCDWVIDISYGNCGSLTVGQCYDYPGECYVDSLPGWYDSSGPYCTGGTYQINNSFCDGEIGYCQEVEYQIGDANSDHIINVLDVIVVINLVLYDSYEEIADMNEDTELNVLDIIELVGIILNGGR